MTTQQKYRSKNREKVRQWARNAYWRNRERKLEQRRGYNLRWSFGITQEEYDAMSKAQGGVCAICSGVEPCGRRLAVDHDHATGRVRGLLCTLCNRMLGCAKDKADYLRRAAAYLEALS